MKQESSPPKEPSREEHLAEAQRIDEEIGPRSEWIPLHAVFEVARTLAEQLGVPQYKTHERLAHALRKAKLVTTSIPRFVGTVAEEWSKSEDPELPQLEHEEITSKRAINLLFERRSAQRRRLDLKRKKAKQKKSRTRTIFQKTDAESRCPKSGRFQSKAESSNQKAESATAFLTNDAKSCHIDLL